MASRVLHEKMTFEPRCASDEGTNLVFRVSKTGKENQQIGSRMEGGSSGRVERAEGRQMMGCYVIWIIGI